MQEPDVQGQRTPLLLEQYVILDVHGLLFQISRLGMRNDSHIKALTYPGRQSGHIVLTCTLDVDSSLIS